MTLNRLLSLLTLWALSTVAMAQTCPAGNPRVAPDSRYTIDSANGVVTDLATGLMWKRCSEGQSGAECTGTATMHSWSAALGLANTSGHAGFTDWRLPNREELRSLVETACFSPSINAVAFPATVVNPYWSSTTFARSASVAWSVVFNGGFLDAGGKSLNLHVRLVRGGQWLDPFASEADSVPDAFTLTPQSGVPASSLRTSDPVVTVAGLTTVTGIGVSGAAGSSYSINGGPFTAVPGSVANGDQVRVRHTSAAAASTSTTTTLTIGGVAADFVSTTGIPCTTNPVVANGNDSGAGSLRQAIVDACAGSTITFAPGVSTATLTTSELVINKNLSIDGGAGVTVTRSAAGGTPQFRIFNVLSGNTVAMNRLVITNGNVSGSGGGILSSGALTLSNCTLSGNTATLRGGGLAVSNGSLDLTGCSLSGNTLVAGDPNVAGGGLSLDTATGSINGCTISGNTSTRVSAVLVQNSTIGLTNCTISGNIDPAPASSFGAVFVVGGTVTMTNATVANHAGTPGVGITTGDPNQLTLVNSIIAGNQRPIGGTVSPLSRNNLIPRFSESFPQTGGLLDGVNGNLINVTNARIAPLGNYGGPLQTIALLPGSPAINAGTAGGAPTTDQRGIARVGAVDIGAFESRGFTLAIEGGNNQVAGPGVAFAQPLAVRVTSVAAGEPVTGGAVSFAAPGSGASATLASNPASINASGVAATAATANSTVGSYTVSASASGASAGVNFVLENACASAVVTNGNDSGAGSLRQIIADACVGSTITFAPGVSTVTLSSGQLAINKNLTIQGPGANLLAIDANNTSRVFFIDQVVTASEISGLTVTRGNGVGTLTGRGGGILVHGVLTLRNSAVSGNSASSLGGGILVDVITPGTGILNVIGSLISGNTANGGGGIFVTGERFRLSNSTISGNRAVNGAGGGITNNEGSVGLSNATIVGNTATLVGGGVNNTIDGGPLTIGNSLIFGNTANGNPRDVFSVGAVNSEGFNLIGNLTGTIVGTTTGNQIGVNPRVAPLADNGGPTQTHALLPGSPAINAGSNALAVDTGGAALVTDQRGFARLNGTVDIGAFESRGFTLAVSAGNNQSALINAVFANPLSVTVSSAFGEPVDGGAVSFTPPGSGASAVISGNPATVTGGIATSGTVTANGTAGGPYTVVASAGGASPVNFSLTNISRADLAIEIADSPDPVLAGGDISYVIGVRNNGPGTAVATQLSIPLQAGLSFQSILAPGGWGCTTPAVGAGGTVNCSFANFTNGATSSLGLVARVDPATPASTVISLTGTTSSSTNDPDTGNNSATATTTVDPAPTVTVTPTTLNVSEAGPTSSSFTVRLSNAPSSNVTVALSFPGDQVQVDAGSGFGTSPQTVTLTPANAVAGVSVAVRAVDDSVVESNPHAVTITTANTASSASAFDGLAVADVGVSIADNDTAGVTVTQSGGTTTVTEGGGTDSYTVVLTSQPTANVTVNLAFNAAQLTVNGETDGTAGLTFTSANWNVAQPVNVTAVDDTLIEANPHSSLIVMTVSSGDAAYAVIDPADVTVSIAENDTQQITFSQASSSVGETAGTHTVTARLNLISNGVPGGAITAAMSATVNATPGSAQAGDFTLGTTSLTFPAGSAHNATLPISVAIINDRTVEGEETFTLGLQLVTALGSVSGTQTVTINDEDSGGVIFVNPSSNVAESVGTARVPTVLTITGTGTGTATLGVDIDVGISQAPGTATTPADYQLNTTSLSFAAGTETGARRDIEVAVVNDALIEGSHNFQLGFDSLTTTAMNASANGLHTMTLIDDDLAGVAISESGGSTVVTEGGAGDTLTLTLTAQPTSDVTITFDVGTQVSFAPNPLVITPAQWNVPQTIAVTAVDDAVVEGPHSATVGLIFTGDSSFAAITPNSISQLVSITDNDVAGVTVTQSGGNTAVTEGGATDTYTLVLTSQPTANVVIAIAGGTQLTPAPTPVTFTAGNWNQPQTVTVSAVDDAIAEGPHNGSVTHTVTSSDTNYGGRLVDSVSATITDNDTAGVTVTQSGGNTAVTEGGATDTVSVVLTSQPLSGVTVTLTPNAQLTVSPSPLSFTAANWNVAQVVTVTAANDNVVEGNHSGTLGFAVASTDPAYGSITLPSITAAVTDNDTATVSFSPATVSQSEATSPMAFTVMLSAPVASGVTVSVNSTNGTATAGADYTAINGQTVSFAANSTTAQTVNVAISNDALDEDNETYSLTLSNLVATGNVTLGAASTGTGTIEDDDALPVLSVANVTQPEGNTSNALTFTVTLSPVSGRAVSFTRATVDGTAVSTGPNADFVAIPAGGLTIPAGQTSVTIPVTINGDATFEGDESFTLSLTGITNANVGGPTISGTATGLTATATLTEDDQQPTTTTITADLPDPSVVGQPYPVTVEVRAQTLSPLGTVSITDGTGANCNAALTPGTPPLSTMSCTLTSTSAGAKTLTATYTPATTAFGESSDTEAHAVNAAATSLVLLGPARARIGTVATYTAELSVTAPGTGTPAGTVTVSAGANSCTITLPTATPSCGITYTTLGSRSVSAVFAPGNGNFVGSTATPVQTLVFATADLSVTKTNAVNTYRPGDLLVYTVIVRNNGPDAAPQIRVRDVAPAGLTNVAWTCEASLGAVCPDAGGTGTLDHVVETLPSNSVLTYAYFGNVIGRPLSIVNVAELSLPVDTTIEDPNAANNSATDTDLLDDLFADGFEAPGINSESGGVRLASASLRSALDEVARVTVRLTDVRGEALRVYARVVGGELQVALAVRGADGTLRSGSWQRSSGEPELTWTATPAAGGFVLSSASLR